MARALPRQLSVAQPQPHSSINPTFALPSSQRCTVKMSMKALVLKGPYDVKVEQRAIPRCKEPTDVVVKVRTAGLCGSDLRTWR